MDVIDVRKLLALEREARYQAADNPSEWTQDAVAKRAKIEQSLVSKIEKVERPYDGIQARTLLAVIEQGLLMRPSDFFAKLEGQTNADLRAELIGSRTSTPAHPLVSVGNEDHSVQTTTVTTKEMERIGHAIGRGIRREIDKRVPATTRKAPKSGKSRTGRRKAR